MLSNVKITLKSTIPTSYGTGDTFTIFETGIVAEGASVVFSSKTKLERFQVDIATTGVCTIVLRGLDNTEIKNEVAGLKEERDIGANGYITVLASDIFDKDATSPQVLNSPFVFNGAIEMKAGLDVEGDTSLEGLSVTGQSKPFPDVADEAARDVLYPSPTGGEMVIVAGEIQKYNVGTAQWETLDVGTPLPDATETNKGKIRIATDVEALAGTEDTVAMTPKKVNDLLTQEIEEVESSLTDTTFMLGEACTKGDSLFKEVGPTFARALTGQNIGDVAGNTRVRRQVIGSGNPGSGLNLCLQKVDNLGADLLVRIEDEDGQLVNEKAEVIVPRTSLSTSRTDFGVVFPTGTNNNAHGVTLDNTETVSFFKGITFTLTKQAGVVSVEKAADCTANKAYLYDDSGNLLQTVSFSGNIATLNNTTLLKGKTYSICVGSDGNNYTSVKQTGTASLPYILGDMDITEGAVNSIKLTDAHGLSFTTNSTTTQIRGVAIVPRKKLRLYKVTKDSSCTATHAYIVGGATYIFSKVEFVGNVANFRGSVLDKGLSYRIAVGSESVNSYISRNTGDQFDPIYKMNIIYTGGFSYGSVATGSSYDNIVDIETEEFIMPDSSGLHNIVSFETNENIVIPEGKRAYVVLSQVGEAIDPARFFRVMYLERECATRPLSVFNGTTWTDNVYRFCYVNSNLFAESLLAKTYATRSYGLPKDIVRFAKADGAIGEKVKCSYLGIVDGFNGMTPGATMYIGNAPGAISAVAGDYSFVVGKAISDTKLFIKDIFS